MSTDRDVTRIVRSWLHEDAHEDADRVLNLVLDEIDTTPQRRSSWSAWRFPPMNSNFVRVALVAAAVVIIAVVGFQYLGNANTGDPDTTGTPQPTASPASTAEPTLAERAELAVGSSHVLWDAPGEIKISVTVPASGWFGGVGRGFIIKDNKVGPPDGAGVLVWQGPLYVYGDRCRWATTLPETPATTDLEIVEALIAHTPGSTTALGTTLGGYRGGVIKLEVPDNAVFADCDGGEFRSWVGDPVADDARYHQGPGQDDYVWVLDVNGTPVVIDLGSFDGTNSATADEMDAIVHSVVFELP